MRAYLLCLARSMLRRAAVKSHPSDSAFRKKNTKKLFCVGNFREKQFMVKELTVINEIAKRRYKKKISMPGRGNNKSSSQLNVCTQSWIVCPLRKAVLAKLK